MRRGDIKMFSQDVATDLIQKISDRLFGMNYYDLTMTERQIYQLLEDRQILSRDEDDNLIWGELSRKLRQRS